MNRESNEIQVMRNMAWERAKGELRSMLTTYYDSEGRYDEMRNAVNEFVERVEMNALQE